MNISLRRVQFLGEDGLEKDTEAVQLLQDGKNRKLRQRKEKPEVAKLMHTGLSVEAGEDPCSRDLSS